jgi:hypothetical protein
MSPDNENGTPPDVGVAFRVVIVIDTLDRLQVIAPDLALDRVALICARASDWTAREMLAQRMVEVLMARQRGVQIPGGSLRLPPPPGRS